ncbi:hypothetical protein B0H13DRAFT_2320610 [Mycena leptocephala]|nr:hypothetical protein B0H13DRAFT_2320610 [Mycena leptocephala]
MYLDLPHRRCHLYLFFAPHEHLSPTPTTRTLGHIPNTFADVRPQHMQPAFRTAHRRAFLITRPFAAAIYLITRASRSTLDASSSCTRSPALVAFCVTDLQPHQYRSTFRILPFPPRRTIVSSCAPLCSRWYYPHRAMRALGYCAWHHQHAQHPRHPLAVLRDVFSGFPRSTSTPTSARSQARAIAYNGVLPYTPSVKTYSAVPPPFAPCRVP